MSFRRRGRRRYIYPSVGSGAAAGILFSVARLALILPLILYYPWHLGSRAAKIAPVYETDSAGDFDGDRFDRVDAVRHLADALVCADAGGSGTGGGRTGVGAGQADCRRHFAAVAVPSGGAG